MAFSAGVDSSALFFLLLEHNIAFDIALVNYGVRQQSKKEEAYALFLAQKYNLKAHIVHAPRFENNFEKSARDFRYDFFDKLMAQYAYDNLITAHQLNDKLEWFLMRLTKGAGAVELVGLESLSRRKGYHLVRPLLHYSKEELLDYLHRHGHHYFVDQSNTHEKYERNYFRREFSDRLLEQYQEGIKRSFAYLKEDKEQLLKAEVVSYHEKELYLLSYEDAYLIPRLVDRYLKILGYLLSSAQRAILKNESSVVFGDSWAVEIGRNLIYIAPYRKLSMPKIFKEQCRKLGIPKKIRPYLYEQGIEPKKLVVSS